MGVASAALLTRTRSFRGVGTIKIYTDPDTQVCVPSSDPLYAGFMARINAVTEPYFYISPSAIGGKQPNTTEAVKLHWQAGNSEQKSRHCMPNCENPWLSIFQRRDADGVSSSWATGQNAATVAAEASYQGVATPTTLAQYRDLGVLCWQSITNWLLAQGVPGVCHYASVNQPFGGWKGLPRGNVRATSPLPPGGGDFWAKNGTQGTITEGYDYKLTSTPWLCKAQEGAIYGDACYNFLPNAGRSLAQIGNWSDGSWDRRNGSGVAQTPPLTAAELKRGTRFTSARMWRERITAEAAHMRSGAAPTITAPKRRAAIVHGMGMPWQSGVQYIGGWGNMGWSVKDPQVTAEDECAAIFADLGVNWPLSGGEGVTEVWVWNLPNYSLITVPFAQRSAWGGNVSEIDAMRWAHEVDLFQRPWPAAGWSWTQTPAEADAYYTANCNGDAVWNLSSFVWHDPILGSMLPPPCVIDESCPLAPWLDFSAPVFPSHVKRAMQVYGSELCVRHHEEMRKALDAIRR